ncbi:hypothetical protein [Sinomonas halotolerans]|uniref:Tight adherence protein B n=1 Tax=Sinomonas halotolerans TaxID=1644133 RepID=A0ABU9X1I3_9MICC
MSAFPAGPALVAAALFWTVLLGWPQLRAARILDVLRGGAGAGPGRARGTAVPQWSSGNPWTALRRPGPRHRSGDHLHALAALMGQLSALLRAGRSPDQMWGQAVAALERTGGAGGNEQHTGSPHGIRPGAAGPEEGAVDVLKAAARAAALGRPVSEAIRTAAAARTSGRNQAASKAPGPGAQRPGLGRSAPGAGRGGHGALDTAVWLSVAACVETAESSGAPLAAVLDRLAVQLESDADAAAARAVALAGPQATAKVLGLLPLAGLGIGMLMGVDPLGLLLSTPLGMACLGTGIALALLGRAWSARLVRSASEER